MTKNCYDCNSRRRKRDAPVIACIRIQIKVEIISTNRKILKKTGPVAFYILPWRQQTNSV